MLALIGLLIAALGGGAALAAVLADGDGEGSSPSVSVRTVTRPGTTVEQSVTVTTTAAPPTTATTTSTDEGDGEGEEDDGGQSGGSFEDGVALTDEATELIRQGRYAEALPKAQQALAILEGTGDEYEAYANYDVGKALAELGRCEEALPYLEKREQMLGPDPRVTEAKQKCS